MKLAQRLDGLIVQRANFQKTIDLAQEQLQTWETANRNALVNAAKDGMEYFIGWLTHLTKRGKAADRLQRIYEKNATQMAQDGLNVTDIAAKIKRLKATSMVGKLADVVSNASDWQSFIKNGSSSLLSQLSSSNDEVRQMLEDPKMQKYFETEAPELNTLLDISTIAAGNEVFGKWVAKKVPMIALVEISINQTYNGLDWALSFYRIVKAHDINGQVMHAATSIQKNIDATYVALGQCR